MTKKTEPTTQVNAWDEQLAALAQEVAADEIVGGNTISVKAGCLTFKGEMLPGNKLTCVIVAGVKENAYYEDAYDPENPKSPVCFAFADNEEGVMRPHPMSTKPQCENCAACPKNKFGSADRGRGKACKNIRRLGMIAEGDLKDETTVEAAEFAQLKLPVTSVNNYKLFVNTLANTLRRPTLAVLTEIGTTPDPKHQFHITFKAKAPLEGGPVIGALLARRERMIAELARPYEPNPEDSGQSAPEASTKVAK